MKRIKGFFFWQLNTPFLFYVNMKTAMVSNLHTHFALLCTFIICYTIVQFSGVLYYELASLFYLNIKRNL